MERNWDTIPKSEYKCQSCGKSFKIDRPGPVHCPICGHIYVDWTNFKEVIEALGDYGRA